MSNFVPIADTDRVTVREPYEQRRTPTLWERFPKVRVHTYRTGNKSASYRLPSLDDGLLHGRAPDWRSGEAPPTPKSPGEATVTIADLLSKHTEPDAHAMNMALEQRLKRYRNKAPRHLDQLYRDADIELKSYLTSSTYFSSETFTGGALDVPVGAHQPDLDINSSLRSTADSVDLRAYQHYNGTYRMVAVMDSEVARVLARHSCYSGRYVVGSALGGSDGGAISGGTTGTPAQMPMAAFAAAFKDVHGLDAVEIVDGIYDSADQGETSSITRIHSGLLWIGLLDTGDYDLIDDTDGPDGALAIALSDPGMPEDRSWFDNASDMEYFGARFEYGVITPRYTADSLKLGVFWPSSEIFT